ncbi:MAG: hypothetical protein R3B40_25250 [Polyangiales bacterium]
MTEPERWPHDDPQLMAQLATLSDALLHTLMCDCAEHALEVCAPIHRDAGFDLLPEREPIELKRSWLVGGCTDAELADAQQGAVWHCYWGNPIALGAAVLGAAWQPGSGLTLAEDEAYAEAMTWYDTTLAAAGDVLREAVRGVGDVVFGLRWRTDGPAAAPGAAEAARAAERAWQRERVAELLRGADSKR